MHVYKTCIMIMNFPPSLASKPIFLCICFILSHPLSLCAGIFSSEKFITLRQRATEVICTIFHCSDQQGAEAPMTAAVCALLNHCRKVIRCSTVIREEVAVMTYLLLNYQQRNSFYLVYTL